MEINQAVNILRTIAYYFQGCAANAGKESAAQKMFIQYGEALNTAIETLDGLGKPKKNPVLDRPLQYLDLPTMTYNVLMRRSIDTVGKLYDEYCKDYGKSITKIRGIGGMGYTEIRKALEMNGLLKEGKENVSVPTD